MKLVDILDGNGNSIVVDPIPTKQEVIAKLQQFIRELEQTQDGGLMMEAAKHMAAIYRVAVKEMGGEA